MFPLKFCHSRFDLMFLFFFFFPSEYNYSFKGFLASSCNVKDSLDLISVFWRDGMVV